MIYRLPEPSEPLDQGDIIQECPLVLVENYDPGQPGRLPVTGRPTRVIVLTQACDLANQKAKVAVVAAVLDAQELLAQGLLKPADIKGPPFGPVGSSAGISSRGIRSWGFPR